jgi:hypothetical protein
MEEITNKVIAEFVSTLLASRTQAHIYHWQAQGQGSYAAHKALNEYYDEIVGLVDELVETYQGKYGIIYGYLPTAIIKEDGSYRMYFEALSKYVDIKRQTLTQDSYIQNQIDEITGLVESTKYKLKNLM